NQPTAATGDGSVSGHTRRAVVRAVGTPARHSVSRTAITVCQCRRGGIKGRFLSPNWVDGPAGKGQSVIVRLYLGYLANRPDPYVFAWQWASTNHSHLSMPREISVNISDVSA